jgi:tetratricopeptide (TPR) repeat protein
MALFGRPGGGFGQDSLITDHYEIHSEDQAAREKIAGDLEGRFAVYTRIFRFNPQSLAAPLKVRLMSDTEAYDRYLINRLGEKNTGALYLHYRQTDRRELVVNYGNGTGWEQTLPYQSFVQYLRSFIANPPVWIEEGFAIYFSTLSVEGGESAYTENLSWLERVKELPAVPVWDILLLGIQDGSASFPREDYSALSWALVSFFLNSGNDEYFRSLLECFLLLSPDAGLEENTTAVAEWIVRWNGFENLDRDYYSYVGARKTFSELMNEGRRMYGAGDLDTAEPVFAAARDQRPGHYAPYYYLGLIAYGRGAWDRAERYYNSSLERGADRALVYYALGLNAAAAEQGERAAEFLGLAVEADPVRYSERANTLLRRIQVRQRMEME